MFTSRTLGIITGCCKLDSFRILHISTHSCWSTHIYHHLPIYRQRILLRFLIQNVLALSSKAQTPHPSWKDGQIMEICQDLPERGSPQVGTYPSSQYINIALGVIGYYMVNSFCHQLLYFHMMLPIPRRDQKLFKNRFNEHFSRLVPFFGQVEFIWGSLHCSCPAPDRLTEAHHIVCYVSNGHFPFVDVPF